MSLATVGDVPSAALPKPSHLGKQNVSHPAKVGSKAMSASRLKKGWTAYTVPLAATGESTTSSLLLGKKPPGGCLTSVETLRVLILRSLMANPLWVAPPPKLLQGWPMA